MSKSEGGKSEGQQPVQEIKFEKKFASNSVNQQDQTPKKATTQTDLYEYDDIFKKLTAAREKGAKEFKVLEEGKRNVSGDVTPRVIRVNEESKTKTISAIKTSGYDENFRTSEFLEWERLDREFKLESEAVGFKKAFLYSRLPTNSYIHFADVSGSLETTGHVGGLLQPPSVKGEPRLVRSESERHVSNITGSGNKGARTTGSVGNIKGFHGKRQNVINRVVAEAKKNQDLRKSSPEVATAELATAEVLKYVVNNTVGYRDNTKENKNKFKGVTTDGLNLEDEVSRDYALKHYQAVRDTMKLAALKHENRFNDVDSLETSDAEEFSDKISRLNRKLKRTVLAEKYHGEYVPAEKRSFSPLRYSSPYSRAALDISIGELEKAKKFEEVTRVYSNPIPTIKLTEEAITKEEERAKKAAESKVARNLNYAEESDFITMAKEGKLPEDFTKKFKEFFTNEAQESYDLTELSDEEIAGTTITNDERFVALLCFLSEKNISYKVDYEKGFIQILTTEELVTLIAIQDVVAIKAGQNPEQVAAAKESRKERLENILSQEGFVLIPINFSGHFTLLAIDSTGDPKKFRYIDSLRSSKSGDLPDELIFEEGEDRIPFNPVKDLFTDIKEILDAKEFQASENTYQAQQYSEEIHEELVNRKRELLQQSKDLTEAEIEIAIQGLKEKTRGESHNNECGFLVAASTVSMINSASIEANLADKNNQSIFHFDSLRVLNQVRPAFNKLFESLREQEIESDEEEKKPNPLLKAVKPSDKETSEDVVGVRLEEMSLNSEPSIPSGVATPSSSSLLISKILGKGKH